MTRLQTYRAFLAAMAPSSSPDEAIQHGYYVEPPGGGIYAKLATSLELEPDSTHLLLGGVGSGKTSELLRARDRLDQSFSATGDEAWYCDVSRRHNLASPPQAGVLFALTALRAIEAARHRSAELPDAVAPAVTSLNQLARGHTEYVYLDEPLDDEDPRPDDWYDDGLRPVYNPGVIRPPPTAHVHPKVAGSINDLRTLLKFSPGPDHNATILFDSLDRLPNTQNFKQLIADDLIALKTSGVGVAVVGPIRFMVGTDRAITDLFDHIHFQLATDPGTTEGLDFLCNVLWRRSSETQLLSQESLPLIARASGGILRDLIAIARRSAEEAYASGSDTITPTDISAATQAFGRSLAVGLDDDQVNVLTILLEKGSFVVRGERELSLIETRRVVHYAENRWAVHPTLADLILDISGT